VNGSFPSGGLTLASNGKLYGLTNQGGSNAQGVIFEFDPNTLTYTKKVDLEGISFTTNSMIRASNGKLYGLSNSGGANGSGILFEYNPFNGSFSKKADLDRPSTGGFPSGDLIETSNGKLYGMTIVGGANDKGTLIEYDTATNIITKKIDFGGAITGSNPGGNLVQAANGKLYGTTPTVESITMYTLRI
jgi:uncharacterized repeat protein (TIGR03803 family)